MNQKKPGNTTKPKQHTDAAELKKKGKTVPMRGRDTLVLPTIILFAISFLLYGSSIGFGYMLDDEIVITKNAYVQNGIEGLRDIFSSDSFLGYFQKEEELYLLEGGRYRPLSLATFAWEVSVFGPDRPDISHFINILLYGMTAVLLFRVLRMLHHKEQKTILLSFPFIAAAVWTLHPIHTESVANIKGRDEILALLFSLGSLWASIRYIDTSKRSWLLISGCFLFLGLLSKESAITFVALVPLTIWFFRKSQGKALMAAAVPLIFAAAIFIAVRYAALGYLVDHGKAVTNLMNDPFLEMSVSEKFATIVFTLGWYLKLLFMPYPLTHDYYPYHVPKMNWSDIRVITSLLVYVLMCAWALYKIRSRNLYAYAILAFLITISIVSNIVVSVGTFMNERFLYAPSIAMALAVSYFITQQIGDLPKPTYYRKAWSGAALLAAGIFIWISVSRVQQWKDPLTLDRTDVAISDKSARANCFIAVSLYTRRYPTLTDAGDKRRLIDTMEYHLKKAIAIYPMYESALHMSTGVLAARYELNRDSEELLNGFEEVMQKIPHYTPSREFVISYLRYLFPTEPERAADFCYRVGYNYLYKKKEDKKHSLMLMELCLQYNFTNPAILTAASELYRANGNVKKSEELLRNGITTVAN